MKDSHSAPALGRGGECGERHGTDALYDHRITFQREQMAPSQ